MKKVLFLLLGLVLFVSCVKNNETATKHVTNDGTYFKCNGCKYYKVKLNGHDVYQYVFSAYTGTGSDIIHIEDMCEKCSGQTK